MLVLSRRVNERLLIPCIQTTVQVIAAPPTTESVGDESGLRQRLLNRLKNLSRGLALIRHCARAASVEELQTALDTMDSEFEGLRRQLTLLVRQSDEELTAC